MCTCNSANSHSAPVSHLYSYAMNAGHSTPGGPVASYDTQYQAGDILNVSPSSTVPPPATTDSYGAPAGLDSSSIGALLQFLLMLLEMLKPYRSDDVDGKALNTGISPMSMVATPGGEKSGPGAGAASATGGSTAPATGVSVAPGTGLSDAAIAANPEVGQWNKEIAAASKATGLNPNLLGAQIWAESRGNLNTHTRNVDGTIDHGLIQIGQERWLRDIVPHLSAEDRAKIKEATGKEAEQLDVTQAMDNVVAGAFHTKGCIDRERALREDGAFERGLRYYNSGNAANAGSAGYVNNVKEYMRELQAGERLQQDPYDGTFGSGQGGKI